MGQNSHFVILVCFVGLVSNAQAGFQNKQRPFNNTIPALLVFGDSTVDPGNNDYIATVFKGNIPPYGRDFADHVPTGRFTNSRLPTDFIISYVGVKDYVPPYLNRSLSIAELMTGVSFASAGSGFDPLTPTLSNVVPLQKQLEYFQEYRKRLEGTIGKQKTDDIVKKAVFLVSTGTNDFALNYFTARLRSGFSIPDYVKFVLKHEIDFIQGLLKLRATKIAVVGLPPMGCLPFIITTNQAQILERRCLEKISFVASDYNALLQPELKRLQTGQANGARIYYADIYGPFQDMVQNHQKYGFEEVSRGCCGTGLVEASLLCNPLSPVCPDPTKYLFWDSIHPTEAVYDLVSKSFHPLIDSILKEASN